MSLDTIVNVSITRKTQVPTAKGFATPMLVAFHTRYVDRVRTYSSPDDLVTDGFALTDKVYLDAVALCSQSGRPAKFKVGRRATGTTEVFDITPVNLTQGVTHTITWNSQTFSYVNGASETVATVCAGLFTASAGITGGTRANNTTRLTITSSTAGKVNSLQVTTGLELYNASTDPGIAADLTAIQAADPDWYAFVLDSNSEAEINAAAAWALSRTVLFGTVSSDSGVAKSAVTTDVASDLVAASNSRTFGIWRRRSGVSTPAAWIGRCIAVNPGKINWAFRNLAGETVDVLSTTEESAIEAKRFSHYQTQGGLAITYEGKTPKSGEFIDLVVSTDWIKARVQEEVFGALANNDIVPYTDAGIEIIKAAIRTVLNRASSDNYPILVRNSISITVPAAADISAADKATRRLQNVRFSAQFQGALNGITIVGDIII